LTGLAKGRAESSGFSEAKSKANVSTLCRIMTHGGPVIHASITISFLTGSARRKTTQNKDVYIAPRTLAGIRKNVTIGEDTFKACAMTTPHGNA